MLKNISIRSQLIAVFGFLSFSLLAVGGLGLYNLTSANEALLAAYERRMVPLGQLDTVVRLLTRNQLEVTLGLTGDPDKASSQMDDVERSMVRINQVWGSYRGGVLGVQESALADRFAVEWRGGRHDADALIVATPAHAAARVLRAFEPGLAESLAAIRYHSSVTISFGFEKRSFPRDLDGFGFVVPRT